METGELMENIAKRRESLQKELESHVQLKQDIEVWQKKLSRLLNVFNDVFALS